MAGNLQARRRNGKKRVRNAIRSIRKKLRSISAIQLIAREKFPNKTAMQIALRADVDLRSAEFWLSGQPHGISGEALVSLLRSDIGFDLLNALMADARAPWWRGFLRQIQISELRSRQAQQQTLLEKLEREAGDDFPEARHG